MLCESLEPVRLQCTRTFTVVNDRSTEVESQAVCAVNDEEEERETSTVPDSRLEVDSTALVYTLVVKACEDALGTEGLSSANS